MISYLTNSIVGLHTVSVSMRNMKHTMNITATSLTGHVLFQFRFPNIRRPPFIEISHTFHTAEWNADFWRAASGHVHVNPERPENCTFILGYKISIYSNAPPPKHCSFHTEQLTRQAFHSRESLTVQSNWTSGTPTASSLCPFWVEWVTWLSHVAKNPALV